MPLSTGGYTESSTGTVQDKNDRPEFDWKLAKRLAFESGDEDYASQTATNARLIFELGNTHRQKSALRNFVLNTLECMTLAEFRLANRIMEQVRGAEEIPPEIARPMGEAATSQEVTVAAPDTNDIKTDEIPTITADKNPRSRKPPASTLKPVHSIQSSRSIPVDKSIATTWQESALCRQADPNLFHPGKGGSTREAKKVCMRCKVREECLNHALTENEDYGVWGGKTASERRELKKKAA